MSKVKELSTKTYIYVVLLVGILLAIYILFKYGNVSVLGVVLFGMLVFIADNLSAPLPKAGSVSVNFGISLASLILFGPSTALIVTIISIFNIKEFKKRVPFYKHLFNAGQYIISIGIASIVFNLLYKENVESFFYPSNIGVIFLCAYIFFMLNTILTAGVISISEGINIFNVWVFNFAWLIPYHIFLSAMAIAISFLYKLHGPFTLIFTSLPLIIAQYTYLLRIKERKAILNSIMQIVKIMEAKDVYTAGHSIRVASHCEQISRKLRLNEHDIEILNNLANLHDIGKVQIDLSILNKRCKLSEADWVEIKKHPIVGYDIVKQIDFLKGKADTILYHHERIDGKGYPFGKEEKDIPLFAKILAIADAYDAMTSDRPYRRALTKQESIDELEKNKGKQFDIEICDIFINAIKEDQTGFKEEEKI
ncbi:MAG: HD-GYP domain-containing protein [Actinobacteria bacterium]|nr:HD-GYP domain-containing protein [Actinomycetota bacterium]MBL7060870.1 HD-GYP domain-containing protein [Actinomycetota bacterium]